MFSKAGIAPFSGFVVRPEAAQDVIAPAYDALSSEERKQYRIANPRSFLHVTRTPEDEADGESNPAVLVKRGRASLVDLMSAQLYSPLDEPRYLAYQIQENGHSQIGLICLVDPEHFATRQRPHESTRPQRSELLATHFETVKAVSSPIACMLSKGEALADLLDSATYHESILDTDDNGLRQTVWILDPALNEEIERYVGDANLYIVDGHHRAEANRHLLIQGNRKPVLAAVFAASSMLLAGFHRLIRLPEPYGFSDLLNFIERRFKVEEIGQVDEVPEGSIITTHQGRWYQITLDERPSGGGPVVRLGSTDPAVIQREIIGMFADKHNIDIDIEYCSGDCELSSVVEAAECDKQIPLLLNPVEIDDIIEVARGGLLMPAKSTYFTPKARSGVFVHLFDEEANSELAQP